MAWIVLIASGAFEAVWATALGRSEGLTRLVPSIVFGVALAISMGGLAFALRSIPTGTGYAVWVGVGAALTVVIAMATGQEPASLPRVLLLVGLVGCIVGLRVVQG
jgi:quaternary ammonium compound-resistance protein SugE